MKEEVKEYASGLDRPFTVNYNAYTQTIEVLDSRDRIVRYASGIKGDLVNNFLSRLV